MNREHIAIQNPENVCFKCLKETKVKSYRLDNRGYGSSFDSFNTNLQLCKDCTPKNMQKWFNEKPKMIDDYVENYKYEDNICEFISTLPIEGRELFYERFASESGAGHMSDQDWIDYELDILPHEKCKEYGYYSPQEKNAYKDRFSKCKHVEAKIYGDGSKGSKCFRNAFGDGNGNCELNISGECYLCDFFEERDGELKVVNVTNEFYKREIDRLCDMIAYATNRLEKIIK